MTAHPQGKKKKKSEAHPVLIRLPEVMRRTGKSRSSIYRAVQLGLFPQHIKVGPGTSCWIESEIDEYINAAIHSSRGGES